MRLAYQRCNFHVRTGYRTAFMTQVRGSWPEARSECMAELAPTSTPKNEGMSTKPKGAAFVDCNAAICFTGTERTLSLAARWHHSERHEEIGRRRDEKQRPPG